MMKNDIELSKRLLLYMNDRFESDFDCSFTNDEIASMRDLRERLIILYLHSHYLLMNVMILYKLPNGSANDGSEIALIARNL